MTKARTNAMTIHYIPPYSRAKDIHIVALFLKLRKSFFVDFEYLVWLESSSQALSIGTSYMFLECM